MIKKNIEKTPTGIKKPRLVLNDNQKFYLATKEISNGETDLFCIISLFLPVNKGMITASEAHTEISAFDDADSAAIYRETLEQYCRFNTKTNLGRTCKAAIEEFEKSAKMAMMESEENVR